MFYRLIEHQRDLWYASSECTIKELIQYIEQRAMMRDAQIEAIKTYLYLKIACHNRPLYQLFTNGVFTTLDIDNIDLTSTARNILKDTPAAVALLEYARLTDRNGKQLAPQLERLIKEHADAINYEQVFRDLFYGVDYADYLFSLPMGAGKTYLMAAFIYLDLYFATNEPDNPAFAHNFMVLAPSGLKSSIVPSLKHIMEFNPSWIIPEPTASQLKRLVCFEVLDEQKSGKQSNRTRNPNAQKINNHQPFDTLMGLVAITNAEKVILDRIDTADNPALFSVNELAKIECANELRTIISRLPNLSIFIDEVHHAADGDIKLRKVVNTWSKEHTFCGMLGFSGTPYLEKAEQVSLADQFSVKNTDLSNVVYHYPLVNGIDNFLKKPVVKYANMESAEIIREGVENFFAQYAGTTYANHTCAKLAVYCGQIETLEEQVYPLVSELVNAHGMNPTEVILKYHGGNSAYPKPEGAELAFASLDTLLSKVRIILLVQIGKEGWDCKSLTGVILPHEGVCPRNMVLQTSCRCLRQVSKGEHETALIWLNKANADILNKQLKQQQNTSIEELNAKSADNLVALHRYSRMAQQHVPPVDFYQLKVSYETLTIDETNDVAQRLQSPSVIAPQQPQSLIYQQDFSGKQLGAYAQENEETETISFSQWLYCISKESFGGIHINDLLQYKTILLNIFSRITTLVGNTRCYSPLYDQAQIRSRIRQAFSPLRDFTTREDILPVQANLLKIEHLTSPLLIEKTQADKYYPDQQAVDDIYRWDTNPPVLSPELQQACELLRQQGLPAPSLDDPHPERKQTYHYLPYHFDSRFEVSYFADSLLPLIREKQLELYFNGDDTLTEFKIRCYHHDGKHWRYIGIYIPDFLLIQRDAKGDIHKVIIIETKGEGFAPKFAERKHFMETAFLEKNNTKFGYRRFDFLYIEDTLTWEQREQTTLQAINSFFND